MAKKGQKNKNEDKNIFALDKSNYILMAIGFAIIIIGFILMSGGRNDDPNVFNEAMFSTRRLTIAPITILIGFIVEFYAIFKTPKSPEEKSAN
ncbi:MAG: DUF3098 domain-containing protein [Bacteroidales bacterium]